MPLPPLTGPTPSLFPTGGDCDAKIGVVDDKGEHPILWAALVAMKIELGAIAQDGTRSINLHSDDPNGPKPVHGFIDKADHITAAAGGKYSIYDTLITFDGNIEYWDDLMLFPRRISGDYTVGGDGNLPGGETIVFHMECFYPPPPGFADEDGDGHPGALLTQSEFTDVSSGEMIWKYAASGTAPAGPVTDTLLVRKSNGDVQEVMVNPADFKVDNSLDGPFEALWLRTLYQEKDGYGGSFDPQNSSLGFTLAPELGSPIAAAAAQPQAGSHVSSAVSGSYRGTLEIDASTGVVEAFTFEFTLTGKSFSFLGGNAKSGPWIYKTDPDRKVTGTVDSATGNFNFTVPTLFLSDNLQLKKPGTQTAATGPLGGLPIPFTETLTGSFGPLPQKAAMDNCPKVANPDQADADGDGLGDACEGFVWGDPTCDGFAGASDALDTLLKIAGTAVLAPKRVGCPHFNDHFTTLTFGDWNCDGQITPLDALILLERRAGATRPTPVAQCPDLGDFVSTVGA